MPKGACQLFWNSGSNYTYSFLILRMMAFDDINSEKRSYNVWFWLVWSCMDPWVALTFLLIYVVYAFPSNSYEHDIIFIAWVGLTKPYGLVMKLVTLNLQVIFEARGKLLQEYCQMPKQPICYEQFNNTILPFECFSGSVAQNLCSPHCPCNRTKFFWEIMRNEWKFEYVIAVA